MVAVPAATPVTSPELEFTVAMAVLLLVQEPPGAVEVNKVVPFKQMFCVPATVPAIGGVITVSVSVITESQPLDAVTVRL